MPKERSTNPAQAQRKADKQKEINKSKRQLQTQRNEKLVKRNPDRIQRQIDELKELEGRGPLRPKDKETLAQLERDVKGIRRARDALGDAAPKFPSHERKERGGVREEQRERRQNLGKRRRDEEDAHSSDTDPEVRDIPMPRDTPSPIPRQERSSGPPIDPRAGLDGQRVPHALPAKPAEAPKAQLTYKSEPQLRDLRKEATRFVPSAVAAKKKLVKGEGRLPEPEEIQRLEKAGYYAANQAAREASMESTFLQAKTVIRAEGGDNDDLEEEYRKLDAELNNIYPPEAEELAPRGVRMEEVEDDGD